MIQLRSACGSGGCTVMMRTDCEEVVISMAWVAWGERLPDGLWRAWWSEHGEPPGDVPHGGGEDGAGSPISPPVSPEAQGWGGSDHHRRRRRSGHHLRGALPAPQAQPVAQSLPRGPRAGGGGCDQRVSGGLLLQAGRCALGWVQVPE
jgi:hypothetical protein